MALERVQKILAQAGIASRRKAEELITEGAVTINGKIAQLGDKADLTSDAVKVNGKLLQGKEPETYLAFYKPRGVISMLSDPEGRATIADYLKRVPTRVFPVGRLDFMSEGLILLTNDGDFAEKLQRRDDVPRVYHVKVKGHPDQEMLERLRRGARFGNRLVQPQSVRLSDEFSNKARIEIVIMGSGAVDLRAFIESRGFLVERITRAAIGHLTTHGMIPGALKMLEKSQVEALLNQPELGTRMVEKLQTQKTKFRATSEEDREKQRAKARGEAPRLKRIRERQDEYKAKIGAKPARSGDEESAPRERKAGTRDSAPRKFDRDSRAAGGASRRPVREERGYGVFRERDGDAEGSARRPTRVKFGAGKPRGEGRSFDRAPRGEGRSFDRAPRGEGRSFDRAPRSEGRSFDRAPRSEGRSFDRAPRGEGRSFDRAPRGEGRSFDRAPRSEGRSFDRAPRSEGRSFDRAPRGEGRSFDRAPRGEGRSFDRAPRGEGRGPGRATGRPSSRPGAGKPSGRRPPRRDDR